MGGESGEGAVEVAVEHVLVADEFEDFVCGGEGGEEWLAPASEVFIALGVFDVVLEAGDSRFEALGVLVEPGDQEFVEVGCGECASEGGDGFGYVEELRAEAVGGLCEVAVGEGLKELELIAGELEAVALLGELVLKVGDCGVGLLSLLGGFVEMLMDGAGFESVCAGESPEAGCDALDEGAVDDVCGGEFVLEVGEECAEVLGAFGVIAGGDDEVA